MTDLELKSPVINSECRHCHEMIEKEDLKSHERSCTQHILQCKHCNADLMYKTLRSHLLKCLEKPIVCPVPTCGVHCLRKELEDHYKANVMHHIDFLLTENKRMKGTINDLKLKNKNLVSNNIVQENNGDSSSRPLRNRRTITTTTAVVDEEINEAMNQLTLNDTESVIVKVGREYVLRAREVI